MVDLHTHSTASDGTVTPEELVAEAANAGIELLALTDHDTIAGVDRAAAAAERHGIALVPGCELDISFTGGTFHLLALGVDPADKSLQRMLREVAEARTSRNLKMVGRLREAGIEADYASIGAYAGGTIIGRPHFARYLVELGYVSDIQEAFHSYLAQGKPFHEQRKPLPLDTALSTIHGAGGLAVAAHPRTLHLGARSLRRELRKWKARGLDGMETDHANCPPELALTYRNIAGELGLYCTGGSDYHGPQRHDRQLGYVASGRPITEELLPEPLKRRYAVAGGARGHV